MVEKLEQLDKENKSGEGKEQRMEIGRIYGSLHNNRNMVKVFESRSKQ